MKQYQVKNRIASVLTIACILLLVSCQSSKNQPPTASFVDLESFMGTWYVVGYTPILVDKKAHNATEHYYLKPDGKIKTTYQFRKGSFDGPLKTFQPVGFVRNEETNAEWGMQFIWPFKADYLILHYDDSKGETIIGHSNRKYAWIMLRAPEYEEATYRRLLGKLEKLGYKTELIQTLPQDWSNEQLRMKLMQEAAPQAISKDTWRNKAANRDETGMDAQDKQDL
jgi:apolipoprotein D and lipocalin family protein